MGTPKTLLEAIQNGIKDAGSNPCIEAFILNAVRDFLAQRIGAVMLAESPEVVRAVADLWAQIRN